MPIYFQINCMDSSSQARFCIFENALLDFSKMVNVKRSGRERWGESGSRSWEKGFLSTHCDAKRKDINYYEFYAPSVQPDSTTCQYVVSETTLVYSHDDTKNIGHTMSDFMNVRAMLWLADLASPDQVGAVNFLNIDAIRMGHNYLDELFQLLPHYQKQFTNVLKAKDFGADSKVCFKKLVFMPRPVLMFTWDGWWTDMPCTFLGPSSLFQRWNLQIRHHFHALPDADESPTSHTLQVLLIDRKPGTISSTTNRIISNMDELQSALRGIEGIDKVVVQDLGQLSLEKQVALIGQSSILIGMHGELYIVYPIKVI